MASPGLPTWSAFALAALVAVPTTLQAQWVVFEDLSVAVGSVSERGQSSTFEGAMSVGPFVIDADYGTSSRLPPCLPNADAVENCYDLSVGIGARYRFGRRSQVLRPYVNVQALTYSSGTGRPDAEFDGDHFGLLAGGGVVLRRPSSRHGLKVAVDWRHLFLTPARDQARVLVGYLVSFDVDP